jgi:glycosyltransferase involved in cell wall biosynthesis
VDVEVSRLLRSSEVPAGWVLVEGKTAKCVDGLLLRLRVGDPEATEVPLAAIDGGRLVSPAVLTRAGDVWIERDDGGPLPDFDHLGIRSIGRYAAIATMLWKMRSTSGVRQAGAIRTLVDALIAAAQRGPRHAAEMVTARYLWSIRSAPDRDGTPVALRTGWIHGWPRMARFRPIRHLRRTVGADGASWWNATGEDPGFRLDDHGQAIGLAAGWYRVRMRLASLDRDEVLAPVLYADHGEGYSHDDAIELPLPGADGRIDTVVLFRHDVSALRFDPALRPCVFRFDNVRLARLTRPGALARMLRARPPRTQESTGPAAGNTRAFFRTFRRHGLSVAAADLYEKQSAQSFRGNGEYSEWIRKYDTLGKHELDGLRKRAEAVPNPPLISIILPVYQTPLRWLRRCLDSVLDQCYGNWELCIADDASPDPSVRDVLAEYAAKDARIRVVLRDANGHISAASNTALALAQGDYVALLDHDDELRPNALLEMAEAISGKPDIGLLYSDEDKIDESGRRFHPYFKPDWNPDLLLSQNYVCHFTVIRRELVENVGGFREGFEGSQDHDLILRCAERLAPHRIHHVAKVLYHWRAIEGSTSLERDSKDYASAAGVRAVSDSLERQGGEARAEELAHGHYRVRWKLPLRPPKAGIIIPTRDRVELLRGCIESVIARTEYPDFEILIVDNQSSEPEAVAYLAELERRDRCRVLRYDAPFNYSAINNWAVARCDAPVLCLLNNDIEVISPGWLDEMVGHALRPNVGAVGAMLYYPDDTIQHAGVILGIHGVAGHVYAGKNRGHPGHGARALVAQNLSAVTGACLVVQRHIYESIGGLDESLQVAFNDIDFCLRLVRAGYRNVWTPFAELYHHESASRGREDTTEKKQRFEQEVGLMRTRWAGQLDRDPAYNANLSLRHLGSELAFPPRASAPRV